MTLGTLCLILISVSLSALAQVSFKFGVAGTASVTQAGVVAMLRHALLTPGVLSGLTLYGLGTLLWLSVLRRIDVSQPIHRAYGPACEEDECGMVMDAGMDNTGQDTGARDASGQDSPHQGEATSPRDNAARDMPDTRKLAQVWVTLWQSELSAMAADPEIRESWQTVMALWAGTMGAMLRGLPREPNAPRHDRANGRPGATDAPRAAPAAPAPDARDAEIDRLARHVAALERRLADVARRVDLKPVGDTPVHPTRRSGRKPRR